MMMSHNFDLDFESIAREAWERQKSPLEKMYDQWVGQDEWRPDPQQVTFRIHDKATDSPIPCHLCGSTDKWVVEGDEVREIARVFICEHEPISIGRGAIRQISSVPVASVGRLEETGRPLE